MSTDPLFRMTVNMSLRDLRSRSWQSRVVMH